MQNRGTVFPYIFNNKEMSETSPRVVFFRILIDFDNVICWLFLKDNYEKKGILLYFLNLARNTSFFYLNFDIQFFISMLTSLENNRFTGLQRNSFKMIVVYRKIRFLQMRHNTIFLLTFPDILDWRNGLLLIAKLTILKSIFQHPFDFWEDQIYSSCIVILCDTILEFDTFVGSKYHSSWKSNI